MPRQLKAAMILISFSVIFSGKTLSSGTAVRIFELNSRVHVLKNGPWAETMTVLDAGAELVVVDTFSSHLKASEAMRYIRKTFHKPVTHVINTHHHWDHTFGNQVFDEAKIIAHVHCAEDMKTEYADSERFIEKVPEGLKKTYNKPEYDIFADEFTEACRSGFRLTLPDRLVEDVAVIKVGDLSFKLFHVPGLHTRSNLTIFVPELGLLFTRRQFHHDDLPALEPGVDMGKLIGSLEAVLAEGIPVKHIMVGHGNPVRDPDLTVPLAYLKALRDAVAEAHRKGAPREDAAQFFDAKPFSKQIRNHTAVHASNLKILGDAPR